MKKIFSVTFLVVLFLFISNIRVKAISFYEGAYINNSYVIKEKNGVKYYLQMQYIMDENGNYVYCLEPFKFFENNQNYIEYKDSNFYNYSNLSKEQIRKIEILSSVGYNCLQSNYANWYAITQVAIWKIVDPSANIYFTDRLNGNRISDYDIDVNELVHYANIFDSTNNVPFQYNYTVNYGDDLSIEGINTNDYEVLNSSYEYSMNNGYYQASNLKNDGTITVRKKRTHFNFNRNPVIYDTETSQDLISPGDFKYVNLDINVKVTKSKVKVYYEEQNSYYSVEAEKDNICYNFYKGQTFLKEMCLKDNDNFIFEDLPYGNYSYALVSNGEGYIPDYNIHTINISEPEISIKLPIVKLSGTLTIDKSFCKDKICNKEANAKFNIYDMNGSIVNSIETADDGLAIITLGYGSYLFEQISGVNNYEFVKPFILEIKRDGEKKIEHLFDNYVAPPLAEDKNSESKLESKDNNIKISTVDLANDKDTVENVEEELLKIDNPDTGESLNLKLILLILSIISFASIFFTKIKAQ